MKPFALAAGFFLSALGLTAVEAKKTGDLPPAGVAGEKTSSATDLSFVLARVNAKLKAGKNTEADLSSDLKAFDRILVLRHNEGPEALAQVILTKAQLYIQVLNNFEEGARLLQKIKTDYPKTPQAEQVEGTLAELAGPLAAQRAQTSLKVGSLFPNFVEKDITGAPLSLAALRGKVVLVDFWATWSETAVNELPGVFIAYQKYHSRGFEVVGISLDEQEFTLRSFLKKSGVTWPQYFDGKGWANKLAKQYGITTVPAKFLLDAKGRIVARDVHGSDLDAALAKLLPGK